MERRSLYFLAPRQVAVQREELSPPAAHEVTVRTLCSAISPGTEHLIYAGLFPPDLAVDETIPALAGAFAYPLKYGYSTVGEVIALGESVPPEWLGRVVFAFNPHESHFNAPLSALLPVPEGVSVEQAAFLPNMETALNLVMDGRPMIGERVVVFGQGIVGLLTTTLLARFPLGILIALEPLEHRRRLSLACGATLAFDPAAPDTPRLLADLLPRGADLCFEVSGAPQALDQAIALSGFSGRIVVGSWYGRRRVTLDLGGRFHRNRLTLISSQVSSLAPPLSGRWDKTRRFELAWRFLASLEVERFVTHRLPLEEAPQAYRLLEERPEEALQVLFTYP